MKYEIRFTEDDKPQARRADKEPLSDEDRAEARALIQKMLSHQVCWNCASEWSRVVDISGIERRVCWVCARTA